jgi:hypothetical protein
VRSFLHALAACPVAAVFLVAAPLHAQQKCSALPGPQIVVQSGDTQEPMLKTLGQKLRNSTVRPLTILYNLNGTCTVTENMYAGMPLYANPNYIPSTAEMPAWDPTQPSPTCTLDDPSTGVPIDVGIAATFPTSCDLGSTPAGLGLIRGPIQAYAFIVPKASDQQAILAEEAYFVFGFGNVDMLTPWNNDQFMFIRPPTKSTVLTLAAAIGVPANQWNGQAINASDDLMTAVATSPNPEPTIGILGSEIYDANRSAITELAFRAYEQHHAYLPDSTTTSFDKRNLRDGHYTPWAPTVYITAVDNTNTPTNSDVAYLIDLVLGEATTDINGLDTVIYVGLTPDCAMGVTRSYEGGPLSIYSPTAPCDCYFEASVPNGSTHCMTCTDSATCGSGACRYGYCEPR